MKIYRDEDANLEILKDKVIAVLGYGSQGHAHALNLRDSGLKVIVGVRKNGPSYERAKKDGFEPLSVREACEKADIIMILLPDQTQPQVYKSEIEPALKPGKMLLFAHGFNIHYNQIVPPKDIDVAMVAPKAPGHLVRRQFVEGKGVPCLIAIHQDATNTAFEKTLAYAKAIGGTKAGVIETTFKEETETDLFGEQVVLCGGVTALIKSAFEILIEAGYKPEVAYFECLHELKLIVDLIYEGGLSYMRYSISDTAEYGDLTRGPRIINEQVKNEMRKILKEIQSGEFAREWILENQAGRPVLTSLRKKEKEHPIEKVGKNIREMIPWLKAKKVES